MLNASVDVQRVLGRLRRPPRPEPAHPTPVTTLRVRGRSAARQVREGMDTAAATAHLLPSTHRRRGVPGLGLPKLPLGALVGTVGHERSLALLVAGILVGASALSVAPGLAAPSAEITATAAGATTRGDTGGPWGDGPAPRIAVAAALSDPDALGSVEEDYAAPSASVAPAPRVSAMSRIVAIDATAPEDQAAIEQLATQDAPVEGPFLADGTLLKPVAVDTVVADGASLIKTYKVKAGDTLKSIAKKHDVSLMTLWWANKLKSVDGLKKGMELRIPPVNGLVVKVKAGQTLDALAKEHKVDAAKVVELNGLEDTRLVVGQTLILPGAKGDPLPKPKPKPNRSSGGGSSGGGSARPPTTYSGGGFAWPAPGATVSQPFRSGHYGLDIDGDTGDPIVAAARGTVTFAGWKNNGGGYQVWIAHGSGLYTTYNHMASVSVGRGQSVGKGQRIGRMGATGLVTGSHLHFEVWRGPIWNGGKRVNPMGYF